MKLYEIEQKLNDVIEEGFALDEETGEWWNSERLDDLEADYRDKCEAVAVTVKNYEAEAAAIAAEVKNLQARQKALKNRAEWLHGYLDASLCRMGLKKLNTARVALSFRKSEKTVVLDAAAIPRDYMKIKEEPNLTAIKKAIKAGEKVPGAEVVTRENLQIK